MKIARAALITVLALSTPAAAQVADHLQCFKVKDALAKTTYTVTLTPTDPTFPAAAGCTIKVPAKMLCVDVTKTNVVGTPPPGNVVGAATDKFLCYKAKCPKAQPTATVVDQFGTHQVTVKGTGLLCAPAPTPTTTTTASTTTTTGGCTTDTDCTPTGNECQPAVCSAGVCTTQPKPVGTPCSQNGGSVCDANSTCVQCVTASGCPGMDTGCQQRTCTAGTCGIIFLANGTPASTGQTPGDCQTLVCDGNGNATSMADNSDVPPDDGIQCTQDTCVGGVPSHPSQPFGFPCNQNGGTKCDGGGDCVP